MLIWTKRCLYLLSNELLSFHLVELWVGSVILGQILVGHTASGSVAHHKELTILHLIDTIVALRKDEAVGLSIHGLWTESGRDQVDITTLKLSHALRQLKTLNLDAGVLLWHDTLTLGSVVVGTWLSILLTENGISLAKLDLAILLQMVELPPNEGVIVGVPLGGVEGSAPVHMHSKLLESLHSSGWEEVQPVHGVGELGNFFLTDANLEQDLILSELHWVQWLFGLNGGLFLRFTGLVTSDITSGDFFLESVGSGLDW